MSPDNLRRKEPKNKYEAYSKDLFSLFSGVPANDVVLSDILPRYMRDCTKGSCTGFHRPRKKNIENANEFDLAISNLEECITRDARPLTKSEVQRAIDLVKQ